VLPLTGCVIICCSILFSFLPIYIQLNCTSNSSPRPFTTDVRYFLTTGLARYSTAHHIERHTTPYPPLTPYRSDIS